MKPSIYALMIAVLTSCTAQYVPLDFDTTLNNTQSYIEIDSVSYSLEFLSVNKDFVSFWLQVENNSSEPVFFIENEVVSYSHTSEITPNLILPGSYAQSPAGIRWYYREKEKAAQGAVVFAAILGAAVIAVDVAGDIKDSKKETWTAKDEKKYVNRNAIKDLGLVTADLIADAGIEGSYRAREEKHYLPNELFKWYTMDPGSVREGKVVFSKNFLHQYFRVKMNSNEKVLNFDFRKVTAKEREYLRSLSY